MEEVWVDIRGYEGLYQISNHGNVRSLDRPTKSKSCIGTPVNHRIAKGKMLKQSKSGGGLYQSVGMCKEGKMKTHRVNRLVAINFLEKGDNHTQVNHIDGNKENNHVSNLEWCTGKENMRHAFENGLCKNHRGIYRKRLTETEVLQILELNKQGLSSSDIAKKFKVTFTSVRSVLRGVSWSRLTGIKKERTT